MNREFKRLLKEVDTLFAKDAIGFNHHVGLRIKIYRKYYQLSQQAFADKIGVCRRHVIRLEQGKSTPRAALIKLLKKKRVIN